MIDVITSMDAPGTRKYCPITYKAALDYIIDKIHENGLKFAVNPPIDAKIEIINTVSKEKVQVLLK